MLVARVFGSRLRIPIANERHFIFSSHSVLHSIVVFALARRDLDFSSPQFTMNSNKDVKGSRGFELTQHADAGLEAQDCIAFFSRSASPTDFFVWVPFLLSGSAPALTLPCPLVHERLRSSRLVYGTRPEGFVLSPGTMRRTSSHLGDLRRLRRQEQPPSCRAASFFKLSLSS